MQPFNHSGTVCVLSRLIAQSMRLLFFTTHGDWLAQDIGQFTLCSLVSSLVIANDWTTYNIQLVTKTNFPVG